MKISRSAFPAQGENTVKRTLLIVAAALMFLNTFVIPTVAHADGMGGQGCPGGCKP
jgi:hypothetical protein